MIYSTIDGGKHRTFPPIYLNFSYLISTLYRQISPNIQLIGIKRFYTAKQKQEFGRKSAGYTRIEVDYSSSNLISVKG